jgi:sialic acid synthase SpsE
MNSRGSAFFRLLIIPIEAFSTAFDSSKTKKNQRLKVSFFRLASKDCNIKRPESLKAI